MDEKTQESAAEIFLNSNLSVDILSTGTNAASYSGEKDAFVTLHSIH